MPHALITAYLTLKFVLFSALSLATVERYSGFPVKLHPKLLVKLVMLKLSLSYCFCSEIISVFLC